MNTKSTITLVLAVAISLLTALSASCDFLRTQDVQTNIIEEDDTIIIDEPDITADAPANEPDNKHDEVNAILLNTIETPVQREIEATELIEVKQLVNNVFSDPNPNFLINSVHFNPAKIWYEDGNLIAEMHVTNGFHMSTVYNLNNVSLEISNNQGIIAAADFGAMQGAMIGPYGSIIWTFVFGEDIVLIDDADLTGWIYTQSYVRYNY